MNKKILDFPEAAEFANDDYIIFDSESGGGCRIKAKKIAPVILGIEAIYTQTQEVTPDTPLNDLKQDLVVNALYRNNRKKAVTDYTLNGTLAVGTSTITVTYSGFTTTFNVEVSSDINYLYNWDFTQSLTDSVQGQAATLTNASRTSNGVSNNSNSGYVTLFDKYNLTGKTVEIDFTSFSKNTTSGLSRFICANSDSFFGYDANNSRWICRLSNSQQSYSKTSAQNSYNDITMKLVFTNNYVTITIIDDESEIDFYSGGTFAPDMLMNGIGLNIGWPAGGFGLFTVTGVRIYDNL